MKHSLQNNSLVLLSLSFLFTGCVSMGTSVGFNEEDNEYFTEDISDVIINTKVATKTDAEVDESDNEADTISEAIIETESHETVVKYRETHTSSRGYWRSALQYLQTGNEDDARWALENSLALNPKSKIANELMYQLDVDAINALGSENFSYKVQYGDSLSKLAKLYLKDSLRFYLLAKYNDISDPSRLVVGQVIQIPGEEKFPEVKALKNDANINNKMPIAKIDKLTEDSTNIDVVNVNETPNVKAESLSETTLAQAKKMLDAGDYLTSISIIKNSGLNLSENKNMLTLLVTAYTYKAKQLVLDNEYTESKKYLNQAISLEPDNNEINMMLIDMNEIDEADLLYEKGEKAFASHDLINAHALISQALETRPDHQAAAAKKIEIEKSLVQHYYKQALMAQRKHELDSAITHWDALLMIDENNDNAKLYRAKAISLKIKLERFVSTK